MLGVLSYTTLGYGLDHSHGESSGYVDLSACVASLALGEAFWVAVEGASTRSATFVSLTWLRELD